MTEQEVRRYLRKISEQNSQTAFREFYDMTYDRTGDCARRVSQTLGTPQTAVGYRQHRRLLFHPCQKCLIELHRKGRATLCIVQ